MDKHELRDLYIKETGNPLLGDASKYADWLEEKTCKYIKCPDCGNLETRRMLNILQQCPMCKIDYSNFA